MRIISQSGIIDLPYEQIMLIRNEGIIRAIINHDSYVIAEYSTSEQAKSEMWKLRIACQEGNLKVFQFEESK